MIRPLDPQRIPLTGQHLIEASAGTGKTYTITGIYLRLLLERELTPDQILVVTYTEAACQELRDKIRARLASALAAFETGMADDGFLTALIERHRAEGRDERRARGLLNLALINVDLAAVHTIHGFCLRVLQDSAFESGLPFDLEFLEDDGDLVRLAIDDYWRRAAPSWPPVLAAYLQAKSLSPDVLTETLARSLQLLQTRGEGSLRHGPVRDPADVDSGLVDRLSALWRGEGEAIADLLLNSPALSRAADKYPEGELRTLFNELDRFAIHGATSIPPLKALGRLTTAALARGVKPSKAGQAPAHSFFEAAGQLIAQLDEAERGVILGCLRGCGPALAGIKAARGQVTFDDLLTAVRDGLRSERTGAGLRARILAQYPVALIDEFQDTDPCQCEIFHTIFGDEGTLYQVGDPKQAIYSFRGADIFSYLRAAGNSRGGRYTLVTNWRSEAGMIKACNALFAGHPAPFVLPGIDFREARTPPRERRRLVAACLGQPMTVATFADAPSLDCAVSRAAALTASSVRNLLLHASRGEAYFEERQGESWRRGRSVATGDIAILVRTHRQGLAVKEALAAVGLTSVLSSRKNVFATEEARELAAILDAVLCCDDERKVRRALSTRMLHADAEELVRLEEDEFAWEQTLERFSEYRECWFDRGVAAMLRRLWAREEALPALARQANGERRLTNLRHLLELLEAQAASEGLTPEKLLLWFDRQRRRGESKAEAALLRLESDEELIKIVTVHKSKGLQYPVVFAPFFWDSPFSKGKIPALVECHDEHGELVADMGSDAFDRHRLLQQREVLAEELRLFYVAVTRAEHRCVLFWGRVKSRTACSPLQYLLNRRIADQANTVAALSSVFDALTPDESLGLIDALAEAADNAIGRVDAALLTGDGLPTVQARPVLRESRVFTRSLNPYLGLRSFSSLHQTAAATEEPDHDSLGAGANVPEAPAYRGERDMFSFPRGAQAGSCLHAIMEAFDFQERDVEAIAALVREKLAVFGFDGAWGETVTAMLVRMVETPLDPARTLRLRDIPRNQRLDELEFYYRLPAVPDQALRAMILDGDTGAIGGADGRPAFMKGFIDLVFHWRGRYYIVDYKSNFLGPTLADYAPERLASAMRQAGYDLQYRIYTEALHRYLTRRLSGYEYHRDFGGVYYLFVRGLDPASGAHSGIYFDRPVGPKR